MRKFLIIAGLEVYAVVLALMQFLNGVRTDEAKYLLNIPYPHPPFMRSIFHAFEWMPYQEIFLRVILATLLVQVVWLVWDMQKSKVLCGMWLASSVLILQAGTIMMAPITAVQGLVFVYLYTKAKSQKLRAKRNFSAFSFQLSAFFWLGSLFTAYQAILFAPIVAMIFWNMPAKKHQKLIGFFAPIFLVALYVLSNPLALASFVNAGGQNTALSLSVVFWQVATSWFYSGSIVLSIVGTVALLRSKNITLLLSFGLVMLFLCVSFRSYYGILFLPLFIGGMVFDPWILKKQHVLLVLQCIVSLYVLHMNFPQTMSSNARSTLSELGALQEGSYILIDGSFGHEWQYESSYPVYRYTEELVEGAAMVIQK